jgi:hypothetical protein
MLNSLETGFVLDVQDASWEPIFPLYEGMLWAAPAHRGLLHAISATHDPGEALMDAHALGIVFFEDGRRCGLSSGAGFAAGELGGVIEHREPDGELVVIPLKLVLPPVAFLGAYQTGQAWGGPEEGGWTYDTGSLVEDWTCTPATYTAQRALMQQLIDEQAIGADTLLISYRKVLTGWPKQRPRYC